MRKLASVERIWKVEPIEGADRIELVHVLGWQCVANKGQFQPGDLAVYFEIDSFLPIREEFEFLRSSSYKNSDIMGEGFKLRTLKFRGCISQGLVLPVSVFHEIDPDTPVGTAVADKLGVKKWEIEERATTGGTVMGPLPYCIPHTDETRIQNEPDLLTDFAGLEYYISTKMDGSSHSLAIDEDGLHVTGHNYEYKDDGSSAFYEFVKQSGYLDRFKTFFGINGQRRWITYEGTELTSMVIQGEFCAPGIQRNRLKLTKPEWYVFTIIVNGKRVGMKAMVDACQSMNIPTVPIEEIDNDLPSKYPTVEALLARADGQYPNGGPKEGVVIRPTTPVYCERIGAPLSMKVINNKYLLKEK